MWPLRSLRERGFDAASMEDVARAAGITKASIYHHVPSKEALLARGLDRALAALFGVLDEPAARSGSARERLATIVRRVAEITMSMRAEVSVLFRVRGNSTTERDAMERRRTFDARIADLVREAQATGEIRADIEAALDRSPDLRDVQLRRRVVPPRWPRPRRRDRRGHRAYCIPWRRSGLGRRPKRHRFSQRLNPVDGEAGQGRI